MRPLVMVVDENLTIQDLNGTARDFLGPDTARASHRRSGDAFNCAHCQEDVAGCGHGRFCQICPIREAVTEAHRQQRVVHRRTKAETGDPSHIREVHLLVTATPLPPRRPARILLVMEDISAMVALLKPVPVCASCKRIRSDDRFWEQVEEHFRRHFDLDLSHGVCADCQPHQLLGDTLVHLNVSGPRRTGAAKTPRVPR